MEGIDPSFPGKVSQGSRRSLHRALHEYSTETQWMEAICSH
jgi:hypothetical protein